MDLSGFSGASGVEEPEDEMEEAIRADRISQAKADPDYGPLEDPVEEPVERPGYASNDSY